MIEFYIYISLLLIMVTLLLQSLRLSCYSPKKIKTITLITIATMCLRYITLLILFLAHNIRHLYLLKSLFFMNLIGVPLIALTVLYIFMRSDSINFSYVFIAVGILVLLYSFVMYRCTCLLQNSDSCGYNMIFVEDTYIYWIYIALNTIALSFAIGFMGRKNIDRIGMSLIILASTFTIVEYIMWIIGITIIAQTIIGDMIWCTVLVYALNKVRKKV